MNQNNLYARLELITSEFEPQELPRVQQRRTGLRSRLQTIGHALVNYLVGAREPRIAEKQDLNGDRYYDVFDPIDGRRRTFNSEESLRVWLEGRYYQ